MTCKFPRNVTVIILSRTFSDFRRSFRSVLSQFVINVAFCSNCRLCNKLSQFVITVAFANKTVAFCKKIAVAICYICRIL